MSIVDLYPEIPESRSIDQRDLRDPTRFAVFC